MLHARMQRACGAAQSPYAPQNSAAQTANWKPLCCSFQLFCPTSTLSVVGLQRWSEGRATA